MLMEQALGHVTYTRNLQTAYAGSDRFDPTWLPVPFPPQGRIDRLPLVGSNWTARGSRRAFSALRRAGGPSAFDAVLYHTQTIALSAPVVARRAPVILSLDATPANFDTVGSHYQHRANAGSTAERVKRALHTRIFRGASALTTWSQWAKDSLRDDYGVNPALVTVIAPGVNLDLFPPRPAPEPTPDRPLRLLFVGGDFARKGGQLLLEGMRAGLSDLCTLHLVTPAAVPPAPGVVVHAGLGPNDPRLLALYRDADIFVLPTYADCLAVVLAEAMAAALPIVTTSVAAQPEAVSDGHSGIIVPPGDAGALCRALRRLIADPELRQRMGRAGRVIAEQRFDVHTNAQRLLDVLERGIARWRSTSSATHRVR